MPHLIPIRILNKNKLDIVYSYTYLGVHLSYNGKFTVVKNKLCCKEFHVMFALLRKCNTLQLPVDIQSQLVDVLVKPILLYGCEGTEVVEKLNLRFYIYIGKLHLRF